MLILFQKNILCLDQWFKLNQEQKYSTRQTISIFYTTKKGFSHIAAKSITRNILPKMVLLFTLIKSL